MPHQVIPKSEFPLPAEHALLSPVYSIASTTEEQGRHFDHDDVYGSELLNIPMRDDDTPDGRTNGVNDSVDSGFGGESDHLDAPKHLRIAGGSRAALKSFDVASIKRDIDQPANSFSDDRDHLHHPDDVCEHLLGDRDGVAGLEGEPVADLTGAMPSSHPNGRRGKRRPSGSSGLAKVTKVARRRMPKRKSIKTEVIENEVQLPQGFDQILSRANESGAGFERLDDGIPRRRDSRRCETKVMLRTQDGHLFTKFYDEEDMRDFAAHFKQLRCDYGFSQADVGTALGRRYGSEFSQTTISRFEGMVLSHSNMCKLRPPIEEWLKDVQQKIHEGIQPDELRQALKNGTFWAPDGHFSLVPPVRPRRKRTSLDLNQKHALQAFFVRNQRPDNAQIMDISNTLSLDYEVVRVWFCNRRQKMKRIDENTQQSTVETE